MFTDLKHLSEGEVEYLMHRYYSGASVSTLLKEYQLSIPASQLYKHFPPEILPTEMCDYCLTALVRNRLPKSASPWLRSKNVKYCIFCHHTPNDPNCRCANCVEKETRLQEKQKQQIKALYTHNQKSIDFNNLSFEQKVFLGALCRGLSDESLFQVKPLVGAGVRLTPSPALTDYLYSSLLYNGIITISPSSPIEAFCSEDFPQAPYLRKVIYNLNLYFSPDKRGLFNKILNPTYYSDQYKDEALCLWKKIAIEECVEYLTYELHKVRFDFTPDDKTRQIFEILLNDFSVSQIYYFIFTSKKAISTLFREYRIKKEHVADRIIKRCAEYGERAKTEGWNVPKYNRRSDLPQSELSAFFFYKVLGIGSKGFTLPPMLI